MKAIFYRFLYCSGISAFVYFIFFIFTWPNDNYLFIIERWLVSSLFITAITSLIEYVQDELKKRR